MPNSSTGRTIESKASLILDLPPSCIEFCPAHSSYFVVGTYNLVEENGTSAQTTQSRNGSLIVFRLDDGVPVLIQTVPQPSAIFHLHFGQLDGRRDVLGTVSSAGTFSVFRLDPEQSSSEPLRHISTSRIPDIEHGFLFLFFEWHPTLKDCFAVTMSNGLVCLVDLDPATLSITRSQALVVANALECWCVAFSSETPEPGPEPEPKLAGGVESDDGKSFVVYSGGDDSILRYASYSVKSAAEGTAQDVDSGVHVHWGTCTAIKKRHDAGVTAILPLPVHLTNRDRVVVTGSYDDTLRIFSIRDASTESQSGIGSARVLAEERLEGGVWRLKVMSMDTVTEDDKKTWRIRLLASCMHAGTRIVDVLIPASGDDVKIEVICRFEENKSMNYGSDFTRRPDGGLCVVSTSFYDRLLCVWDIE